MKTASSHRKKEREASMKKRRTVETPLLWIFTTLAIIVSVACIDDKCLACNVVAEELEIGLSNEKPRNHLDMRHRLDSKGQRRGKVIDYRKILISMIRWQTSIYIICNIHYNKLMANILELHSTRISELRVVELLDGLCEKMEEYTLEKIDMTRYEWVKVDDWDSLTTSMKNSQFNYFTTFLFILMLRTYMDDKLERILRALLHSLSTLHPADFTSINKSHRHIQKIYPLIVEGMADDILMAVF
ncbi:hypothetical protein GIB67_026800 [Kingdonia uniflora]|uniref:DUF3456 domain-containing protein n=1 Tax=Kingdonia uniflora TaxID=39325 RepID=A0A7J7MHV2_9MAGN|nr:hypothetical protein GIB67_026800 [Kingdonia uniflora]